MKYKSILFSPWLLKSPDKGSLSNEILESLGDQAYAEGDGHGESRVYRFGVVLRVSCDKSSGPQTCDMDIGKFLPY